MAHRLHNWISQWKKSQQQQQQKPQENLLKHWTQATSLPTFLPSLPQTALQSSCCVSARLAPAVHLPPAAWNWCFTGRMWTHLASQRSVWGEMCLAFSNRPLTVTTKKVTQTHFFFWRWGDGKSKSEYFHVSHESCETNAYWTYCPR